MKIAVATVGALVSEHFGHCEGFTFFTVKGNTVTEVKHYPNPGHRPGVLPNFLADNGAEVIICGGMGGGAVNIFKERGVEVIVGVEGDAKEAALKCSRGELISTDCICNKHEHAGECGGH